ncbi:MAG: MarR family transcriptional regulator [Lachnospiraceae bacterium]|nr:MarR family transcriptional regulator [Lachnospiraceae bacterium]
MEYQFTDITENGVDLKNMDQRYFLVGLLNEFTNLFQSVGDSIFQEISWKQCFVLNCIRLFEKAPTLKELSDMLGSSHQNVKQMLLKLEKTGYVKFVPDEVDKRKQRIMVTEKTENFAREHEAVSEHHMEKLFSTVDPESLAITVQTFMKLDEQLRCIKEERDVK